MDHDLSGNAPWVTTLAAADALRDEGNFSLAIEKYRVVIEQHPDLAIGHYKLGTAYLRLEKPVEAEACFRHAIHLRPDYPEARNNLGLVLMNRGDASEAEIQFRNSLASEIDQFEPHLNLGNLLRDQSRNDEAMYFYKRAVELKPSSGRARERLGDLYFQLRKTSTAMKLLKEAVTVEPSLADGWINLGRCHVDFCMLDEAQECCRQAIACGSTDLAAWHNLLLADNWRGTDKAISFGSHVAFGAHMANLGNADADIPFKNSRRLDRKLRVGFVSGDLRRHSVSYFVEGPLTHLSRNDFELFAYYTHPRTDYRSEQLTPLFAKWRNIYSFEKDSIVQLIRRDRIDILIDLSGHTGYNRLDVFASRAAPVQLSWIGYPNTTGLQTMDYRITDEICDPIGVSENFHSESLYRLPSSFLCYTPPVEAPPVTSLPMHTDGQVTFGSFNSRMKISDASLQLWARILKLVPAARLVLKSIAGINDSEGRERLLEQATRAGIDAGRVTILPSAPTLEEHLSTYSQIDVCLDTIPYNGTTTTCEALWMGVPVVTLVGDRHAARVGASLLTNVGLSELVARSADDYVRIAVGVATDRDRLTQLRNSLRGRMQNSPLLDARSCAEHLSEAMRQMWSRYCEEADGAHSDALEPAEDSFEIVVQGGHTVKVESDPFHSMSCWVLLEQEDWFEDEIRFLRSICEPYWQVLDIGANHGVYSLALASCGAATIWAFEPAASPMAMLKASVALNGFGGRIELVPMALADRSTTMSIASVEFSELTAMTEARPEDEDAETITVTTLDEFSTAAFNGETKIDFIKLDAEGGELAILDGGRTFFAEHSPLIMFECKHSGSKLNTDLTTKFRMMKFDIYKLVPGLGVLVAVSPEEEKFLDRFTLNLFACRPDKASELIARGVLIFEQLPQTPALQRQWIEMLFALPALATTSREIWQKIDFESNYMQGLLAWCGSRQTDLAAATRLRLLNSALGSLQSAMADDDSHPAVAALGLRLCADLGLRAQALEIAGAFLEQIPVADDFPLDRPLPPLYDAFDHILPASAYQQLLHQSIVEFRLDRSAYSTAFNKTATSLLEIGSSSPERSARFERTAALCNARAGAPLVFANNSKIFQPSPQNLNSALWKALAIEGNWIRSFTNQM